MRVFSVLSLSLLAALAACSSTPPPPVAAPAPSAAPPAAPVASTEYFYGTSKIFPLPIEEPVPSATRRVLIRRSIDPVRNVIVEAVVTEGRRGATEEFITTMTISGASFSMEERGGAFRGTGTLSGEPWRWTAWASHSVMPDGATVDSRDQLSGNALKVEKDYRGPHGALRMVEEYTRIDRGAYNSHRAAMGLGPDADAR